MDALGLDAPACICSLEVSLLGMKGLDADTAYVIECSILNRRVLVNTTPGVGLPHSTHQFPVNDRCTECIISLFTEDTQRKMGSASFRVNDVVEGTLSDAFWLYFEKFGGIQCMVHYQTWPSSWNVVPVYGTMSALDIYHHQCVNYQLKKPNSGVEQALCVASVVLPGVPSALSPSSLSWSTSLTSLRLNTLLLGDRGVLPVLEVIKVCSSLASLDLSSNMLANVAASAIHLQLHSHPGIRYLYLSDNDFLDLAGIELLRLLRRNRNITVLKTWGNEFSSYLNTRLARQLEANVKSMKSVVPT
jgi:Leucine-rich repeat (LRR) protein